MTRPPRTPGTLLVSLLITAALAAACSSDAGRSASTATSEPALEGTLELDAIPLEGCEALQSRHCYLPFPSDAYTVTADTETGRRVDFRQDQMPRNADGRQIDPTEWNRNDGFSPGGPIMVWAPQVDLAASRAGSITDLDQSLADDSGVVLLDADTGARVPHWVELDANATNDFARLLIVRPAVNLQDGHRYIVAMRNLVDRGGETLGPEEVFKAYRDRLDTGNDIVEARRPHMEEVFSTLDEAGIRRSELWIAWDFTVASTANLTERLLHLRDDAFAQLGEAAPDFEITDVVEPEGDEGERVARYVHGTFEVPLYLTGEGEPGSRFRQGPDGLPEQNPEHPTYTASFECSVPRTAVADDADPAHPVVYGHGLLGSRGEVEAGNIQRMTDEHNFVYCATDLIGMSEADVPNAITVLADLSQFPTMADRLQQGILNTLFLGRLLVRDDGLASDEGFQVDGRPVIDTGELVYDSNSQGAISGGAVTAVAQDWHRAVLGVPGMNYSTLLQRSTDFDIYAAVLEPAYPDELERTMALGMIQMLWDRAETNGYANHLTGNPLPDTPEHRVLLHVAFGDFQVADVTAAVEARTIGARYHEPLLAEDRAFIDYTFGLEPIGQYPYEGSAVVMWDSGVPSPPLTNTPPRGEGDPEGPHDPHEDPRAMATAREQKAAFFLEGTVIDVCGGDPCLADRTD
jgi:hypothetical protein